MSGHNTVAREDCEISCASHAAEGGRDASAAGERVNAHTANAPIAAFTPASYVRDNVIGLAAFLLALASTVLILPALGVNSSGAVSFTHLDVYKRQALSGSSTSLMSTPSSLEKWRMRGTITSAKATLP